MATATAILRKAISARDKGNAAQAELHCRELLRSDPKNAGAYHVMGGLARDAKRIPEAIRLLETAAALSQTDTAILQDLALAYEAGGRAGEAWMAYQKAAAAAPSDGRILGAAVGFLARIEQHHGLLALYRQAISLGWRDLGTLLVLGDLFVRRCQYPEAEEVFGEALTVDPKSAKALRGRGLALTGLRRFPEAVQCLEAAVAGSPGQPWGQVYLQAAKAGVALAEGAWAEAAELLGKGVELERGVLPQTVPAPAPRPAKTQRRVNKVLYVEIELRAREFEARALLALHAAAAGLDVVLGQKAVLGKIGYDRLPAGLVLVKTMNGNDVGRIKHAAKCGHMVVVLDEEAFGGSGRRPLWVRLNTDPQALAATDVIIAQGREYADLLASVFPDAAARTLVLGNPRVDLYRPEFRKPSSGADSRRGILICSQSQVSNPRGLAFSDLIELHLRGIPMQESIGRDVVEGTKEVVTFEVSMIPQLQAVTVAVVEAFPETPVLFRPHPAEDPALWERAFSGLANVTVSSVGSMIDALQDSKALIYVRGCATGVEAHFQNVPIIRFDGDGRAPEPGNWISSNMGFPAKSPADVVAALKRIDAGESTFDADRAEIAASFHSGGDQLVCVGVADGLVGEMAPHLLPEPSARAKLRALTETPQGAMRDFDEVKFPATSLEEVRELAARLARVAGLPAPGIEAVAHNVFLFLGRERAGARPN